MSLQWGCCCLSRQNSCDENDENAKPLNVSPPVMVEVKEPVEVNKPTSPIEKAKQGLARLGQKLTWKDKGTTFKTVRKEIQMEGFECLLSEQDIGPGACCQDVEALLFQCGASKALEERNAFATALAQAAGGAKLQRGEKSSFVVGYKGANWAGFNPKLHKSLFSASSRFEVCEVSEDGKFFTTAEQSSNWVPTSATERHADVLKGIVAEFATRFLKMGVGIFLRQRSKTNGKEARWVIVYVDLKVMKGYTPPDDIEEVLVKSK